MRGAILKYIRLSLVAVLFVKYLVKTCEATVVLTAGEGALECEEGYEEANGIFPSVDKMRERFSGVVVPT